MMDVPWLSHLIIFITVSSFGGESSSPCPANQFLHPHGICCEFCPIGTFMFKPCQVPGSNPLCAPCKMGMSYMDKDNNMTMCKQCSVCDPESEVEERECDIEYNRRCVCREGFHRKGKCGMEESTRDSQYEERTCVTKNNRKCSCRQGFHEYDGKCVIEESSTEETDFYFEFSTILTCFEFTNIFMMAIFIIVLALTSFWNDWGGRHQ